METTTVRIECSLTGALVLFDAATAFDERFLWALGIATEPEGTSDVVADFPDEEWEDVWRRETSPVMEACRTGELLVDLIERGTFFVRVGEDAASDARSWMRGQGTLVVRSGRLAIAEDAIAPLLAQVRLYIAPDLSSGYAGVDCADERLRPGDRVRVRLLEKKGGRWSAELVRADGRGSRP